jgi:hypothetical protein
MNLRSAIRRQISTELSRSEGDEIGALNGALRLLAKWRTMEIQETFLNAQGTTVMSGPFAGMDFLSRSAEGCHLPKLLGCYEQPLAPSLEAAVAANPATVINIGCAEGYYAVGMGRRMPDARILAFDSDPAARLACAGLAKTNGVADRIEIGSQFTLTDFARYTDHPVLVICDIEGGERELLDPRLAPALQHMRLIVESHECLIAGTTALLIERFAPTHKITVIEDDGQRELAQLPRWFMQLAHLDQLLSVWEWRSGPTPWLVMQPHG